MARHFKDWLAAYAAYAKNAHSPDKFHFWTAISVIAGALERKVWVHIDDFKLYPNMFIMLVGRAGVGKSSAGNAGVKLLRQLRGINDRPINMIAVQSSEAGFYKQMMPSKEFSVGAENYTHSSGYLFGSEGSNTLKDMVGGGSIIPALTSFYDCDEEWSKALVGETFLIKNICFNMLACCTFHHLNTVVPPGQSAGGFASRIIYVVQEEIFIRKPKWGATAKDPSTRQRLFEDLLQIHHLTGHFKASNEFRQAWEEWYPIGDLERQTLKSERMQDFLSRKETNLLKLCQILSVAESNSLNLEMSHWERAHELMREVEKSLPSILEHSIDKEKQSGITYTVLKGLQDGGNKLTRSQLGDYLAYKKISLIGIDMTLNELAKAGLIRAEMGGPGMLRYHLLADPKDHL